MKELNQYINEKLIVNNTIQGYKYYPKYKYDLIDIIQQKIDTEGLGTPNKPLNLNDIDTSKIIDMSSLFSTKYGNLKELSKNGYFDISGWDVSNVNNMSYMFYGSCFNGDISEWNVENVEDMYGMFEYSRFTGENGSLNGWKVKSLIDSRNMFNRSRVYNLPHWYEE